MNCAWPSYSIPFAGDKKPIIIYYYDLGALTNRPDPLPPNISEIILMEHLENITFTQINRRRQNSRDIKYAGQFFRSSSLQTLKLNPLKPKCVCT